MSGLARNLLSNIAASGWLALVQVVFVPVYIALLGIESYGLIGFYMTLLGILRVLDVGLTTTMNREMARYSVRGDAAAEARHFARTLEVLYWAAGGAIGATLWFASPAIARYWLNTGQLSKDVVVTAIRSMAVLVALQWPISFYQGGLLGLQRQVALNVTKATMATLAAVAAVIVLWRVQRSVEWFFLSQIAVAVLNVSVMAALLWTSLPTSTSRPAVRPRLLIEVRGFVAGLSGVAMLSVILTQADKLLLSRLLTLEQFGFYTLASVLANGLAMINAPVFNALFPRFTALVAGGNEEAIEPLFRRSSQWVAVGTVPTALVIALFSTELVALWTASGQTGLATGPLLTALILGTALNGLMNLPYALQLAHGNTSLALSFNLILVAMYLPLLVGATIWFGALGAAWAWTVVNVVYVSAGVPLTSRRVLGRSARGWFSDLGLVVLASSAVVVAWWVAVSGRTLPRVAWFGILACVLVTATAAAAAVLPEVWRSAIRGMAGRLTRSA